MRLLFVHTTLALTGGISEYIRNLAVRSALTGLTLFVLRNDSTAGYEPQRVVDYRYVSGSRRVDSRGSKLSRFLALLRNLHDVVDTHRIELLHAHGLKSALACMLVRVLAGTPYIYTNHGLRYTQKTSLVSRLAYYLAELFACSFAAEVVCVRPHDYYVAMAELWVARRKLHLIPTEIEAPRYPLRKPSSQSRKLCVSVGSAIAVKRPHVFLGLIRSMRKLDDTYSGMWIGDGALRTQMEALAEAERTPVRFVGHRPRDDVFETLRHARCLAVCSEYEVAPLVALEAMAVGCPVVATRFAGVEDIVTHRKDGFVLGAAPEPFEIAELVTWLDDLDTWMAASRAARFRFESQHSQPERMAAKHRAVIDRQAAASHRVGTTLL